MARFKLHAGDWGDQWAMIERDCFVFPSQTKLFASETRRFADLESADVATEESVKRIGGTVGWGAAGALVLGPVGLLAGLLLGGKAKEVTFVGRFRDGKKVLATVDQKTWVRIQAALF